MLDDLKYIHEHDAQDALGVNEKQWQQLQEEFSLPDSFQADQIQNIVLAGMGGSALSPNFVKSWLDLPVPFETVRDYDLPAYVGRNTLVIASSYSGNTEETIHALEQAAQKEAVIVVIAAGGTLIEIAKDRGYPYLQLPQISQPRYAALVSLKALTTLLVAVGVAGQEKLDDLMSASEWLREQIGAWAPTVPTKDNQAKQLAQEIIGKSVVMYSGPKMYPAAYKWKISFNENAKHVAWVNQYPEFNHNEFIGWTKQPVDKPYVVIDIRSNLEHTRTQKRMEVSERLLSGQRPAPQVVVPKGETLLQQLLWTIALGDFTSLYVALLNGINPTPVDLIETFKKSLDS